MELIVALFIGALGGSGVWLVLRPRTFQVIVGLSLLSYAVNLFIFVMGLIFGWMRQRSGSTLLPMALHTANNLFATALVTIQVEWLS